ncbi:hypothetical protein Aab01nite_77770 [Paractinoplanes abujensis]|uniref:Uncharacterized protein n=1 Tax=Paractinoplanes abujensis TaxID=882441 RepID=A0A7W7G1N5_9ACTN|nr:hypothetical protein [Actinoplanes abujensis]MBB4692335.1 hypothetical protein [Actinoplanes abujensis]GID24187.1 hypothetical protein Aab01nite_77770 [Actinoplanes abujensis]
MKAGYYPESGPPGFLAAAAAQARLVLAAGDPDATYEAGLDFAGLAGRALGAAPAGEPIADFPAALSWIWGSLTDEMDAPGRGAPDQGAAAVRHMRRAATEWLEVLGSPVPGAVAAYLDRWLHEECGYERP